MELRIFSHTFVLLNDAGLPVPRKKPALQQRINNAPFGTSDLLPKQLFCLIVSLYQYIFVTQELKAT